MILKEIVDLMDIGLKSVNGDYTGIKVCELGDQLMKWNEFGTGKKYLLNKGVAEHISIDLNGRNGALQLDLSKPITKWNEYFDMVTNYGTSEHVAGGIYQCFLNIHNFTKKNAPMVHVGPPAKGCPWHSPYHFEPWFFSKLASKCDYIHVMSEVRVCPGRKSKKPLDRSLVCSVLIKTPTSHFISIEDFKNINGIEGL